jgi:peptidoglycan DL-endopeptidase CwlO
VRWPSTSGAAVFAAVVAALAVAASVPVAFGAEASPPPSADELRSERAALGARSDAALQELYGLESTLAATRAELATLEARGAELRQRVNRTRRHVRAATRAATVSQRRLNELVRTLYERSEPDPVAVLLGAQSLDEALAGLESLDRAAAENVRVVRQARAARRQLARLDARLRERSRVLTQLVVRAENRALALEAAVAERQATISDLRRREHLTAQQLAGLEAQARRAQQRSAALQSAAAPAPAPAASAEPAPAAAAQASAPAVLAAPAPATPAGGHRMTVTAVGYSLPGRTASGLPVGHGIVAVDPGVIPLGTRMHVPGYGDAVAADTGSAVRGAMIDLWFPTTAQALQWGRRTVTITIR